MAVIGSSFIKIMMKKPGMYLCLKHNFKEMMYISCVSARKHRASASEFGWLCRSACEDQWTYAHRVWASTNAGKCSGASFNHDKAYGFRTNGAIGPPLDKSLSYCCRRWAQLSVPWQGSRGTTIVKVEPTNFMSFLCSYQVGGATTVLNKTKTTDV